MDDTLPDLIEPEFAARQQKAYRLTLSQREFQRLAESLLNADGEVSVDLRFFREPESGLPAFELSLESCFDLACQRTLEPFRHPVAERVRAVFVESEAAAELVPPEYEPWLLTEHGPRLNVRRMIEDELLLAIPLSPRRPGEPLVRLDEAPEEREASRQTADNPFAILAALKSGR